MTKKKLHILFLNSWFPSRVLPANGDFIQRHAEAVALQHHVTAIHVITDPETKADEIVENEENGVRTLICYLKPVSIPGLQIIKFFKAYKKLMKMAGDFDLIHINRIYPAGIMALFQKKPFLATEHFTGYLPELSDKLSINEHFFVKKITGKARYVCPVSKSLGKHMQKLGFEGNYQVVPNVIDTSVFYPSKTKNMIFTLIHISSLNDLHKNISDLLTVIRRVQDHIKDFKFILIGPNPERYDNLIKKLGIDPGKLEITGTLPHYKISEYLRGSDVLLSFSNYETFSIVIKEAFACGVQVISSDEEAIKEYFPEQFGKLTKKGDQSSFLMAILEIYNNKKKLPKNQMHLYIHKLFSKSVVSNTYSNLYSKMLINTNS